VAPRHECDLPALVAHEIKHRPIDAIMYTQHRVSRKRILEVVQAIFGASDRRYHVRVQIGCLPNRLVDWVPVEGIVAVLVENDLADAWCAARNLRPGKLGEDEKVGWLQRIELR
jgi:hypothetical protein